MTPRSNIFEPIGHESVVDEVVGQIEDLIVSGVLRQGAKLPSERILSEQMNVSRPKLREALKRLEEQNLLHVRHGGGTYVARLMGDAMTPAMIDLYTRHDMAFFDYLDYRREQEGFATAWAAERATKADREVIRAYLNRMDAAHQANDRKAEQTADIGFHSAIIDASHNSTLIHMMASIYELTRRGVFYNRDHLRSVDDTGEQLLAQHHEIGQAVLDRQPDAAARAARRHLDFVEHAFRKSQERARRDEIASKRSVLEGSMQQRR